MLCLAVLALTIGAARAEDEEREAVAAAGVRSGLLVWIGRADSATPRGWAEKGGGDGAGRFVVALDTDPAVVEAGRALIGESGLHERMAAERWDGRTLPLVDGIVNGLVCEGSGPARAEILRVLAPGGTAVLGEGRERKRIEKPRSEAIDEWTHFLYDASGNPVSHDKLVAPPRGLRWAGHPLFARHHDHMASLSGMVSAGGRVFCIMDEGPLSSIILPSKWRLTARDAFSGIVLWRRPIESWHAHMWPNKSGPANLPRRLVARGDRLYVTLAIAGPVSALDGATGETLRTFEGTAGTEEILLSEGVLLLVVDPSPDKAKEAEPMLPDGRQLDIDGRKVPWDPAHEGPRRVMAVAADSGKVLWQMDSPVLPLSLAAGANGLFLMDGTGLVRLDRESGSVEWRSEPIELRSRFTTEFAPTVIATPEVVLASAGAGALHAFDAATGRALWQAKFPPSGYVAPEDMYVIGGLVWAGDVRDIRNSGTFTAWDLKTGEVRRTVERDTDIFFFHRCYRGKATERYLMPARTGIEMVDVASGHWTPNHWVRGGCIYGLMPANGLLYAPPHACSCFMEAKLNGMLALSAEGGAADISEEAPEREPETGPAFGAALSDGEPEAGDWPTYRHDAARTGSSPSAVPTPVGAAWETALSSVPSAPVVADGRVFVSAVDAREVCALDATDGRVLWRYRTGGRVDSPPTVRGGRVFFGCVDGWVYALRASDGALAWRLRAGPADRRAVVFGQIESLWPVPGSVLVQPDPGRDGQATLWCVAGRSVFLDGGLRVLRVDPATGRLLSETVLEDSTEGLPPRPEGYEEIRKGVTGLQSRATHLNMPVALPDVLSSDGRVLYMRSQRMDLRGRRLRAEIRNLDDQTGEGAHLFSPHGFLDGSWFHRSYWLWGKAYASGASAFGRAGQRTPAGRIMVTGSERVWSFGYRPPFYRWISPLEYHLFCADKEAERVPVKVSDGLRNAHHIKMHPAFRWSETVPVLVRGMVLTPGRLFIAGPPDVVDEVAAYRKLKDPAMRAALAAQVAALEGRRGGVLRAVDPEDGKTLSELQLDSPPVWDGVAAAGGRLYVSTVNGRVLCLKGVKP
jgi:outer membrane protein assembly factor BamB